MTDAIFEVASERSDSLVTKAQAEDVASVHIRSVPSAA